MGSVLLEVEHILHKGGVVRTGRMLSGHWCCLRRSWRCQSRNVRVFVWFNRAKAGKEQIESIPLVLTVSRCPATINAAIKRALPAGATCSQDLRQRVSDCAAVFVQLVSTEAVRQAAAANTSKLAAGHVHSALETLGLPYVPDDTVPGAASGPAPPKRRKMARPPKRTPEEEQALAVRQAALMAAARGVQPHP